MQNPPAHVGLIPDGLRRWAKANGATLAEAYLRGAQQVVDISVALQRKGVRTVSVYNLSQANLGRRADELAPIYAATVHFFTTLIPAHFAAETCSVRVHGNRELLPDGYLAAARHAETQMCGTDFRINVLAAYDARDELRAACAQAQRSGCDVTEAFDIGEVDMVIRTSPEPLLSGFLPMQSQYAHLSFLATPLNDLTTHDIDAVVAEYQRLPQHRGR